MKNLRIIGLLILCFCACLQAQETNKTEGKIEGLDPNTSRFEYDLTKDVWVGTGGVVITYDDAVLTADKVIWNKSTGQAEAEGNVRIIREGHIFTGEKLRYNFNTKEIFGERFRTGQPPFFASGEGLYIDQVTGKYIATNVFITTDDRPRPAQRLKARKMTLVPGEKFEARHATLEVAGVPVMYFPYYRRNIGANVNHWNVIPGYRSRFGPFLLGTYNWYWSDKLEGAMHVDYRLKRGFGFGPDIEYDLDEWGEGEFKYYYTDDHRPGEDMRGRDINDERQRLYLTHQTEVTSNMTAKIVARYQTDPYVLRDYFESEYRRNVQPSSFLEVSQLWQNWSLNVYTQPRINDFFDTVERLPDVRLTGFRQQLGETPFYYESESSVGFYRHQFGYDVIPSYEALRGDTYHKIVLPKTYFGWLNVLPRVGGRFTYYGATDGDGLKTAEETRNVFDTGVEMNFKASRVFRSVRSKFFELNELRHILQPTLNYTFIPDPSVSPRKLPQFDTELPSFRLLPIEFPDYNSIDSINSRNTMRFALVNRLQTKRGGEVDEFVKWAAYTDWRLNPDDETSWSDLYSDLEFKPKSWVQMRSLLRYGISEDYWKEVYNRVSFLPADNWSVTLGHRYLHDDPAFGRGQNLYITSLYYRLNENWAVRMSHHYEARDGKMEEQYYTLYRDLRNWTGALTLRFRDHRAEANDMTIAFTFSIKAFPRYGVGDDTDRPAMLLGY